ncbi:MAG TPA: hypothetical protein PLD25_08125 [Chloroflexota bacterium]|nr:hypothetical protein [Chloroflexota bacterium]HUM68406.1 hypothetical protein [Chloroflexota bacterium]
MKRLLFKPDVVIGNARWAPHLYADQKANGNYNNSLLPVKLDERAILGKKTAVPGWVRPFVFSLQDGFKVLR